MADRQINNANLAFNTCPDFRLGLDADGNALPYDQEVIEVISGGAVLVGQALMRVAPTGATVPLQWVATAAGGSGTFLGGYRVGGIALDAATAAGKVIRMVKYGFCMVVVGAQTPAANDMGVTSATAGQVDVIAAATGATAGTFAGNILGQFLGTKTGTLAPFWFEKS